MDTRVEAVIGMNFGDEGKGVLTDALAARHAGRTLVVRHNGGAQAGHTVVTPAGRRHVFGHVGSGTFAGAETLLSHFFVSHPLLLAREWKALADAAPVIWADPEGPVTTPFDMRVNQALERARGTQRHGSCGVGFNETVTRDQHEAFRLRVADLQHPRRLVTQLRAIRDDYMPRRLEALGLPADSLRCNEALWEDFLEACDHYRRHVGICPESEILKAQNHVIFEGAQGLLLDEFHPWFPHVTRSRTGLPNIVALCRSVGFTQVTATYVSRWYLTRHGAGPFPSELPAPPSPTIEDRTNAPNDWQGTLRFGSLDLPLLLESLSRDAMEAEGVAVQRRLALTCLDQMPREVPVRLEPERGVVLPSEAFAACIQAKLGLPLRYLGYGPTRDQGFWMEDDDAHRECGCAVEALLAAASCVGTQ